MVNWNPYLDSLCNANAQLWQSYTITDVVGQKRVESEPSPLLFDFGLMVQTVERDREERGERQEKVERLTVLEGLRKYVSEHVLLVGRPGSGKSTALARLLLEEAQKAIGNQLKIPVLVELRYYRTSILDLIQDFLQRHDPNLTVDAETLKRWLRQGQLLLLVDGLNELPSEEARRDLHKLRQDYQKTTPMIFTTRDLGVGGDLDIAKKLEMLPLTKMQMQQFVHAYLPQQGEEMLRQLDSRLREFGQTPLLLWMLCSMFDRKGKVPPNLGLVFRQFALSYDRKLKQDIPISGESRRWWQRMLEHLAWMMTKGEAPTELKVAIPRQQPEAVLTEFLQGKVAHSEDCALRWLEDLLKHHLIQLRAGNQIEFRHQLIQEYYTAECLLKLLPSLSDDCLKRGYLNYLKWIEPLALMLELVEDEAQAVRVVKLALEVDWWLGARLAGAVKPEFQDQTVGLVAGLDVPQLLKIQLLGLTKSDRTLPKLVKAIEDKDFDIRRRAAEALGNIGSDLAIPELVKAIEDENSDVCRKAAEALGNIGSDEAISELVKILEHQQHFVRWCAAEALKKIDSDTVVSKLVKALAHQDSNVRWRAEAIIGKISSDEAIDRLVEDLEHEYHAVRIRAAEELGKIGSDAAIPGLVEALKNENYNVRWKATEALGKIGSDAAISELVKALEHECSGVRRNAEDALLSIDSGAAAISKLIKALEDEYPDVRMRAAETLKKISGAIDRIALNATTISELIKALKDEYPDVRMKAAKALDKVSPDLAIPSLINALENEDFVAANQGDTFDLATEALKAIQNRCKFYNYTLIKPPQMEDKPKSDVKRDQVFISYSHKDKKCLEKLQTMLKPMMRNDTILVWDDTKIQAGAKWRDEIEKALTRANVAVLMVSANFLASDFIAKHELPPLLKAAEQEGLKIIWVPVGYCLYAETEIEQYQAVHNPSQPLESLKGAKLNQVLVKICQEIKAAATE